MPKRKRETKKKEGERKNERKKDATLNIVTQGPTCRYLLSPVEPET